jgi:hypothetical protein
MDVPFEVHCLVSLLLPLRDIFRCRAVNTHWMQVADALAPHEWRALYCRQVCDFLRVSPHFDWRRAAVTAARNAQMHSRLDVWCTWRRGWLCLVSPWVDNTETPFSSLRCGVARLSVSSSHSIDFLYDNAFRLRGRVRTCLQRHCSDPCGNCQLRSKQRCLKRRYDYYIRCVQNAQPTETDEFLSRHLSALTARAQ